MSNQVNKAVSALKAAIGEALADFEKSLSGAAEEPKAKATPKAQANGNGGGSLKDQAQAALDSKKFHHKSKQATLLKAFLASKVDLRSAEGRELSRQVSEVLGLPVKAKAEKPAKPEKAEKVEKAEKPAKAEKAAKGGGSLKDQAQAVLDSKKFHHKSKEAAALKAFVESKADGRSKEGREAATAICQILGLPAPKKPGRAKAEKPAKAAKETPSGKGGEDAASEAPTPSPKKRPGATADRPRTIDAVAEVLKGGTMNAAEVVQALTDRDWLPGSNNPKSYIGFILSQNKDTFEKDPKGRGYYRLKGASSASAPAAPSTTNGSSNGKHVEEAPVVASPAPTEDTPPSEDTDEGYPVATEEENPFADDGILGGN